MKIRTFIFTCSCLLVFSCEKSIEEKKDTIVKNQLENSASRKEIQADSLERKADELEDRAKTLKEEADRLKDSARRI